MKTNFKKILYIFLGFLFLGLGFMGIAIPVLPTTPFLLLASFFFTRGSGKFNNWFMSTKLYKNHLDSFQKHKSLLLKDKFRIVVIAYTMLIISSYFVKNLYFRVVIFILMISIFYYFTYKIKTINPQEKKEDLFC